MHLVKRDRSILIIFFTALTVLLSVLGIYRVPPVHSQSTTTVTIPVSADTFVRRTEPNRNFGKAELLELDKFDQDRSREYEAAFMRFNLSSLANTEIIAAKLEFTSDRARDTHKSIRIIRDEGWTEEQITFSMLQISQAPLMLRHWSFPVTAMYFPKQGTNSIDITAGMKDLGGNSIVIALENEAGGDHAIYSKENTSGKGKPQLVIEYRSKPVESTPANQAYTCQVVPPDSYPAQNPPNPLRGLYRWSNLFYNPNGTGVYDAYKRYTWDQIEKSEDQFDFSVIETDINKFFNNEANSGKKYAFRVRAMASNGNALPAFMKNDRYLKTCSTTTGSSEQVPDWNSPDYIREMNKLITELGKKYNGDQRIAWVDNGAYGRWGEWHMYGYNDCNASTETIHTFVNAYLQAFPDTTIAMLGANEESAVYALKQTASTPRRLHVRKDCVGFDTLYCSQGIHTNFAYWDAMKDRWQYAPFTTEFGNPNSLDNPDSFWIAQAETTALHLANLGNGNTFQWKDISAEGQEAFTRLDQLLGYQLVLNSTKVYGTLSPGATVSVETNWSNYGVTPTYEPWDVLLQLRDQQGSIVYEAELDFDIREILPTYNRVIQKNIPVRKLSPITIPGTIAPGTYTPHILILDSRRLPPDNPAANTLTRNNPRKPLAMAQNRQSDGSHALCAMTVGTTPITQVPATPTPAPDTTIVPTVDPEPSTTPVSPSTNPGSPTPNCPKKPKGDANCDGKVNLADLDIWRAEFLGESTGTLADFDNSAGNGRGTSLTDLQIWTETFLAGG
jgi:hypothetical protein